MTSPKQNALDFFEKLEGLDSWVREKAVGMFNPEHVRMGAESETEAEVRVDPELQNALGCMAEIFKIKKAIAEMSVGMFDPEQVRMGASSPQSYNEFIADIMFKEGLSKGLHGDLVTNVEHKPFEFICWLVENRRYEALTQVKEGLLNLREQWLRHLIEVDHRLDEADKRRYRENLFDYYYENFMNVERVSDRKEVRAFWSRPGYDQIWLISVALAIPPYLSIIGEGLAQSRFLNVGLRGGVHELEKEASEW